MPGNWVGHHLLGLHLAIVILAVGVAGYLILRATRTLIVDVLRELHEQEMRRNKWSDRVNRKFLDYARLSVLSLSGWRAQEGERRFASVGRRNCGIYGPRWMPRRFVFETRASM
jgi:hypothetical protein